MSTVLTLERARGMGLGAELGDEDLQAAIDREEAWLARRIGPLTGERPEAFPLAHIRPTSHEVRLRRPTDEVQLMQSGATVDEVELRHDGWRVALLPEGSHFTGPVECTYTPTDEAEVEGALIELLSLRLGTASSAGLAGEIMGSYSWTRAQGSSTRIRASIVRQLLEPATAGSTRLSSSVRHGLAGQVGR